MTVLSASQQQAIDKLEKLRVGALFMEPGTGKTLTAIQLVESSQADFVLWIVQEWHSSKSCHKRLCTCMLAS